VARFVLVFASWLALVSPALASDGPSAPAASRAPTALFVDGVKVGSTQTRPPKQVVRTSRCTSGCTLMITH